MSRSSAGLLMYRMSREGPQVFLAHPGGPFFARRDAGVWTIPKGEPEAGEDFEAAARREFLEETGIPVSGPLLPLGTVRQKGGKTVHAWAFAGDWKEEDGFSCNTFELEWPPGSGRKRMFPEVDQAGFFPLAEARQKINPAQTLLLDRLLEAIADL